MFLKLQNIMRLLLLYLYCSFPVIGLAQNKISGKVVDDKGIAIFNANVVLKNTEDFVIAYTNSDKNGHYTLTLNNLSDTKTFSLEVSCIGYRKVTQWIIKAKNTYDFLLTEEAIDLSEIKIKIKPRLTVTGDTLSYDVSSFSRVEDRSIGDVLKRLPGISVAENGQISYNGKSINNLFIHGDDLMDGRYGLATKVISKDMIKSVDVVQHFQPVKVLKNKMFTDEVAMNLVLKDENSIKLAGQALLGAGMPNVYDAAFNTMLFNKKIKVLNSLKANNNGVDLKNDLAQLGSSGFGGDVSNAKPSNLLSLGTVGNPDLPKANYYLNNSQLLNTNNLLNLKSGWQIKSNLQLFFDKSKIDYSNSLATYLNGDTINYNETQYVVNSPYAVNSSFTAMTNKNTHYLNNKLSLNFDGSYTMGEMNFNGTGFNQSVDGKTYNFFNDFNYIPALKNSKNVIDVRWYLGYFNNPQHLKVGSGLNANLLNNGLTYLASNQYLNIPTFYNHVTLAYRIFSDRLFQQSYQFGMMNEKQYFNSNLNLLQTDYSTIAYNGDSGNGLSWQYDRVFVNAEYTLKKKQWMASLSIPINLQNTSYKQENYNLNENKKQFFSNPSANFTLYSSSEDNLTANYTLTNNMGKISSVYRGLILTNYRTTTANHSDLHEQQISNASLTYNFRRSIIMFFASAKLNYKRSVANTIVSSILTNETLYKVLLPYENKQKTLGISAEASKYIIALRTTFSASAALNKSDYYQLINTQLYPYSNQSLSLKTKIDSKLFDFLALSYGGSCVWNLSRQKSIAEFDTQTSGKTIRLDESLDLGCTPVNYFGINLIAKHIYGKQANINTINYLFLDARTRYRIVKWRTDIELSITNLANIKHYEVFNLSSNQFYISNYNIRGRMGIVKATFNL